MPPPGPPGEPSDDALMALADAGSFAVLVSRHQSSVRRLCEIILADASLARDVAQQSFLRVWEHRRRYKPNGKFRELLFTVARNESRRVLRRRGFMSFFGLAPQTHPIAEPLEDPVSRRQTSALVQAAMVRLPEHFRVPLALRFIEGMSHEEIAVVIGRTPSTARSRVHYGLKALSEFLPGDLTP